MIKVFTKIFNIDNNVSWASNQLNDQKDLINDAENSALRHRKKLHFKHIKK